MGSRKDKRQLRLEGVKTGGVNKAPPKAPGYVDGDKRKGKSTGV